MRIVALGTDQSASAAYRAQLPMQALAARGHRTDFIDWDMRTEPPFEQVRDADVVHLWRLYRAPARRLANAVKEAGGAVVFDNDDDMTRVPKDSPAYAEMRQARAQVTQELSSTLRLAHLVTTTTGELAGRLKRIGGGDVRVVENFVEDGFVRPRRAARDDLVIGWIAGLEHRGDLKELRLRRTFEQLLERHPHVRLVSAGVDLGVRSDRYVHHVKVPFPELPDMISQFDVGLAPIANVSFNRVRSNVKVKEYAAAGVPWLASPIGPYKELGEEQGGRLVADYRWADELNAIVEDADARARLAERSAAWGRTQTVSANVDQWEAIFVEAAERVGRASAAPAPARPAGRRASGVVVPAPSVPAEPAAAAAGGSSRRRGLFRRRRPER